MAQKPVDAPDLWVPEDGKSRAARTTEILLTLSRFCFGQLVNRKWWSCWLPGRPAPAAEVEPGRAGAARLRHAFEALGPSFVKIGQLLAVHAGALVCGAQPGHLHRGAASPLS